MLTLSYLENTKPFSELWDTWSSSDKKTQLSHLLDNLKKMYARGIYQDDLHLDNILFDGDQLYMVDGMGITLHREKNALSMDFLRIVFFRSENIMGSLRNNRVFSSK